MSQKPTPRIVAYLKPWCGWSNGVRAILGKYHLAFEDRDIINDPAQYQEMVRKSGQPLSPCVEVDGRMLADVSGDEVEAWLVQNGYVSRSDAPVGVSTNSSCSEEDHARQAAAPNVTLRR
jgi:monothiol glutaredoxin